MSDGLPDREDDPERCTYSHLEPRLETKLQEKFGHTLRELATQLGFELHGDVVRLEIGVSVEVNGDGVSWLRLRAIDGTTWHSGWTGAAADAEEFVEEFGRFLADSCGWIEGSRHRVSQGPVGDVIHSPRMPPVSCRLSHWRARPQGDVQADAVASEGLDMLQSRKRQVIGSRSMRDDWAVIVLDGTTSSVKTTLAGGLRDPVRGGR